MKTVTVEECILASLLISRGSLYHTKALGSRLSFFDFEKIDPNSEQAAALDAELAMFLQSREDKARERRRIPWLGFAGIK